jgi:hypothetical protein
MKEYFGTQSLVQKIGMSVLATTMLCTSITNTYVLLSQEKVEQCFSLNPPDFSQHTFKDNLAEGNYFTKPVSPEPKGHISLPPIITCIDVYK